MGRYFLVICLCLFHNHAGSQLDVVSFRRNTVGTTTDTAGYTIIDAVGRLPSLSACAVECSSRECDAFLFDDYLKTCRLVDHPNNVYEPLVDIYIRCYQCDCLLSGSPSTIYPLAIPPTHVFDAYCDMETLSGGWLVIQNRFDGSQEFFNYWVDFKKGFGDPSGEYWLGNEKVYLLTSTQPYELYIEMEDVTGTTRYARYSSFSLSAESDGYRLSVSGYSGNVTDSMLYNNGQRFTTKDMDQDTRVAANCAYVFQVHSGTVVVITLI